MNTFVYLVAPLFLYSLNLLRYYKFYKATNEVIWQSETKSARSFKNIGIVIVSIIVFLLVPVGFSLNEQEQTYECSQFEYCNRCQQFYHTRIVNDKLKVKKYEKLPYLFCLFMHIYRSRRHQQTHRTGGLNSVRKKCVPCTFRHSSMQHFSAGY